MATARIKWIDPITRRGGSVLTPGEIAFITVLMSADNGANYEEIGQAAAGQQQFDQELTDPGTYLFKTEVVDRQVPAKISADSAVVSVTVVDDPELLPEPDAVSDITAELL